MSGPLCGSKTTAPWWGTGKLRGGAARGWCILRCALTVLCSTSAMNAGRNWRTMAFYRRFDETMAFRKWPEGTCKPGLILEPSTRERLWAFAVALSGVSTAGALWPTWRKKRPSMQFERRTRGGGCGMGTRTVPGEHGTVAHQKTLRPSTRRCTTAC